MPRRYKNKKAKSKRVGITGLVEPGYGALYIRTPWMQKLRNFGKKKPKQLKKYHRYRWK